MFRFYTGPATLGSILKSLTFGNSVIQDGHRVPYHIFISPVKESFALGRQAWENPSTRSMNFGGGFLELGRGIVLGW